MPAYIATYEIEICFEPTGAYFSTDYDHEFFAENDEEANIIADDYCKQDIFDDIMAELSISPTFENVEEA